MKDATIGQRRHLVQVLTPQTGNDACGQPLTGFVLLATCSARVASTKGSEAFARAAQQFAPETTHVVSLLNDPITRTITALHWFSWTPPGTSTPVLLDIQWVNPGERILDGIICACIERVGTPLVIV